MKSKNHALRRPFSLGAGLRAKSCAVSVGALADRPARVRAV